MPPPTTVHARVESERLPDQWTSDQAAAATRVRRLLDSMGDDTHGEVHGSRLPFLPRIDPQRRNHVVLINGERGSGKTQLLVSLLSEWAGAFESGQDDGRTRRLVPLPIIDLEPLPPSTHLLLHLVSSLGRVVDSLEPPCGLGDSPSVAPWARSGDGPFMPRKRWEELLHAVIESWDENASKRWRRLDLEAYRLELSQSEAQQRSLLSCLARFLDALAFEFARQHRIFLPRRDTEIPDPGRVLFVIPVDDGDMNIGRCHELLLITRLLWHPRLAFLLTGEQRLFLEILEDESRQKLKTREKSENHAYALDVFNKTIPPHHRCSLRALKPAERLALLQREDMNGGLQLLSLPIDPARPDGLTLRDFLTRFPWLQAALPERIRWLVNLSNAPLASVNDLVVCLLDEERELHPSRSFILHLIESSRSLFVRMNEGMSATFVRGARHVRSMENPVIRTDQVDVRVASDVSEIEQMLVSDGKQQLPPGFAAVVALALMVTQYQEAGQVKLDPLVGTDDDEPLLPGGQVLIGDVPTEFHWPLPRQMPLAHRVLFFVRWQSLVLDAPKAPERERWSHLARAFLDTIIDLYKGLQGQAPTMNIRQWPDIALDLVRMMRTGARTPAAITYGKWARTEAPLLAAPEYGLPANVADDFVGAVRQATEQSPPRAKNPGSQEVEDQEWFAPAQEERARRMYDSLSPADTEAFLGSIADSTWTPLLRSKLETLHHTREARSNGATLQDTDLFDEADWAGLVPDEDVPSIGVSPEKTSSAKKKAAKGPSKKTAKAPAKKRSKRPQATLKTTKKS